MSFCQSCGTALGGNNFCPKCGTPAGAIAPPAAPAPLPPGWQAQQDASGRTFYVNESTKATQWDHPAPGAPSINGMPGAPGIPYRDPTSNYHTASGVQQFSGFDALLVAQTRKGCMRELCGCEDTNEFLVYPSQKGVRKVSGSAAPQHPGGAAGPYAAAPQTTPIFYSLEQSTCCCRFFCKNQRVWEQTVTSGGQPGGEVLMHMNHPFSCPLGPCQCCCNPYLDMTSGDGPLGKITVPCYFCVPVFEIRNERGELEYNMHQPTCCGGMCVDIRKEGICNCIIPFYIYHPGDDKNEIGKINKMWRGLGTEFLTDADTFQVEFPDGATPHAKARLLGSTMLLNMLMFEKANNNNGGGSGGCECDGC